MLDKEFIKKNEKELRQEIVKESLSFLKTPYHPLARIKGVGVDCMTFIISVFIKIGLIDEFEIPHYSPDFMLHRKDEVYLKGIAERGFKTDKYEKGNMILYKMGRIVSHTAIIVDYPTIIHAVSGKGVILDNADQDCWKKHEHSVYSFWEDN